jgi:Skp family chaperone for outer membrane proteins
MFFSLRGGYFVPFALIAVLLLCGAAVYAVGTPFSIGVVDYQTIYEKYDAVKPAQDQYMATYKTLSAPWEALHDGIGLAEDEMKTFQNLYRLGEKNRTADQEKQFQDLTKKAKDNYSLYAALSEKKKGDKLSDEEAKKYADLFALIDPVIQSYDAQGQALQDVLTKEKQRLQTILSKQIDDSISKVAKTQKLSLILNKDVATAQGTFEKIVVWNDTSLDITDKVLTMLNDDFKLHPTIFDTPTPSPVPEPMPTPAPAK